MMCMEGVMALLFDSDHALRVSVALEYLNIGICKHSVVYKVSTGT
jgi:hypothetical protein